MGSGENGEPECYLIGTEDLPLMGAAGVLVLPKHAMDMSRCARYDDDLIHFGKEELDGWGAECAREELSGDRKLDAAYHEKHFHEYVVRGASQEAVSEWTDPENLAQLKELMAEERESRGTGISNAPAQGPTLVQLAFQPKRREECPVCHAQWLTAVRQLGKEEGETSARGPSERGETQDLTRAQSSARRRTMGGRPKMHSTRCCWAWFQQNLCNTLCLLRFDAQGVQRMVPMNPNKVLPPPIMDVWSHWKQKRGDRFDRSGVNGQALTSERLFKGEPPAQP